MCMTAIWIMYLAAKHPSRIQQNWILKVTAILFLCVWMSILQWLDGFTINEKGQKLYRIEFAVYIITYWCLICIDIRFGKDIANYVTQHLTRSYLDFVNMNEE